MMSRPTASRHVIVRNSHGLHARPANQLARLANRFESQIEITKERVTVDAKSILDILTLAATQGSELLIQATGPDAEAAVMAFAELLESNFELDEAPDK